MNIMEYHGQYNAWSNKNLTRMSSKLPDRRPCLTVSHMYLAVASSPTDEPRVVVAWILHENQISDCAVMISQLKVSSYNPMKQTHL